MKMRVFAVIGAATFALAACSGGNQDAVENAELNQPEADLNQQSSDAANAAMDEAAALGNQLEQLNEENAADETVNPEDADEQNVSGM